MGALTIFIYLLSVLPILLALLVHTVNNIKGEGTTYDRKVNTVCAIISGLLILLGYYFGGH